MIVHFNKLIYLKQQIDFLHTQLGWDWDPKHQR